MTSDSDTGGTGHPAEPAPAEDPASGLAPDLFDLLEGMLGGGAESALGGLGDMLRQAQSLGQQEVTGQSGGGAVRVTMTGDFDVRSVHIDPDAVDPADVGMLEDLVLAAFRDAADAARRLALGNLGAGPGGPLGLGPPGGGGSGPS